MPSALIVLTGAKVWTMKDGKPHPCGFWSKEFIEPHQTFTKAGLDVTIATPGGVTPTVDELSYSVGYNDNDPDAVARQREYIKQQGDVLGATLSLADAQASDFDVIFLVGGHGPMQDMAVDPSIGPLLAAMLDDPNKIVAAVCHGPAGFLSAARADGTWLFKDRRLTAFTNEEETQATFAGNAPWLLEDRLRLAGARFVTEPAWTPHVVVDGNLITGQQQVSAQQAADVVLEQLKVAA
jgi:putative intracellular protease/amidase